MLGNVFVWFTYSEKLHLRSSGILFSLLMFDLKYKENKLTNTNKRKYLRYIPAFSFIDKTSTWHNNVKRGHQNKINWKTYMTGGVQTVQFTLDWSNNPFIKWRGGLEFSTLSFRYLRSLEGGGTHFYDFKILRKLLWFKVRKSRCTLFSSSVPNCKW